MKAIPIILFFILQSLHASPLLSPQMDSDEFFSETFSMFADLDNGVYLYSQIGITNIGPGDNKGLCHLLIIRPGKIPIHESIIVDREDWSYTGGVDETLRVGSCSLGLHGHPPKLIFNGIINAQAMMIEFKRSPKKTTIPNSQVEQKSGYYRPNIYIPWSAASANYTVANNPIISLQGYGYVDHSSTTLLPSQLARQWIRFRGIADQSSTLVLARFAPDHAAALGWVWQQSDLAQPLLNFMIHRGNLVDEKSWSISFLDSTGKINIQSDKLLYRNAPLEGKGILKKLIASMIGNPVTRTYRATLTRFNGEALAGILEVSFSNE